MEGYLGRLSKRVLQCEEVESLSQRNWEVRTVCIKTWEVFRLRIFADLLLFLSAASLTLAVFSSCKYPLSFVGSSSVRMSY